MQNRIKYLAFDAYGTLYDVHSVVEACEEWMKDGQGFSELWRKKQLEYAFLRQIMGRYRDFWSITEDALRHTAEIQGIKLTPDMCDDLLSAYLKLKPYPETEEVLAKLTGYRRMIYSNGSHSMLKPLVENSGLSPLIEDIISMDDIKQYKPAPAAYHYLIDQKKIKRDQVLFLSSNTWDIAGAKSFGFQTAWINRGGTVMDVLGVEPDYVISNLNGLVSDVGLV